MAVVAQEDKALYTKSNIVQQTMTAYDPPSRVSSSPSHISHAPSPSPYSVSPAHVSPRSQATSSVAKTTTT